jgi:hypothetical protein
MTAHQSIAPLASVQSLPPDPYSADPWSWAFVLFRPLADFPGYGIDTLGNPWSCWAPGRPSRIGAFWRSLKPSPQSRGHRAVSLVRDGRKHTLLVHRLVLETFVGPCPAGMECCHDPDPDPGNNRLGNLRWDTKSANQQDSIRHGTARSLPGELHPMAKLAESDAIAIIARRAVGESLDVLAADYRVSRPNIEAIVYGRSWKHLPRPAGLTPVR